MRHRVSVAVLAGIALFGLGVLATHDPTASRIYPPCPVHAFTGLYCPGCGSLRALHAILNGEFASALRLNALMVLALPLLAVVLVRRAAYAFAPPAVDAPRRGTPPWFDRLVLVAILAWGVLRNLPFAPFEMLAPR